MENGESSASARATEMANGRDLVWYASWSLESTVGLLLPLLDGRNRVVHTLLSCSPETSYFNSVNEFEGMLWLFEIYTSYKEIYYI